MIECRNLVYQYDNNKVLNNVKFSLVEGNIGVVLGVNGCGKTTLLKCIGNYYDNYKGFIKTNSKCRYLNDLPALSEDLTGIEYVELLLALGGDKTNLLVDRIIDSIGIRNNLSQKISELSIYTKKVLVLLSSLCFDTDFLLIDEPFRDLDRNSQLLIVKLIKLLKNEGKTILVATNLIYFGYEFADDLFLLHRGKIKHIKNCFANIKDYEKEVMKTILR